MRQIKNPSSRSGNRRSLWATISIAASVIALIGITYFVVQPFGTQHIAREYYVIPMAEVQRSNSPNGDSLYQAGMIAFAGKDWDAAISTFGRINTADPDYSRALYFKAHAYAAGKGYEKALVLFSDPVFLNGPLQQQAEWNNMLMMMFLQYPSEEIRGALQHIEGDPDHFYRSKAAAIMNELKSD
jgi:tetratricopeptide (TPR) repeat protein